jgi:hypothetical protein
MLKRSVLDQSPVRRGLTPRHALLETAELAKRVDATGVRLHWLAEACGLKTPA